MEPFTKFISTHRLHLNITFAPRARRQKLPVSGSINSPSFLSLNSAVLRGILKIDCNVLPLISIADTPVDLPMTSSSSSSQTASHFFSERFAQYNLYAFEPYEEAGQDPLQNLLPYCRTHDMDLASGHILKLLVVLHKYITIIHGSPPKPRIV
ncbi:Protein Ycf2 [Frankliniella fusca]|uniref:Protein Ycf2 n=1 Tax=Frankliniella fusca TaxID=407009 RepID=A0AAE1I3P3_9NEOP|nr:Protein Ycf2 [Frankliniella fusca]